MSSKIVATFLFLLLNHVILSESSSTDDYNYDDYEETSSASPVTSSAKPYTEKSFTEAVTGIPPQVSHVTTTRPSLATSTEEYEYDDYEYHNENNGKEGNTSNHIGPSRAAINHVLEKTIDDLIDSGVRLYNETLNRANHYKPIPDNRSMDAVMDDWVHMSETVGSVLELVSHRLTPLIVRAISEVNISSDCAAAFSTYLNALRAQQFWAMNSKNRLFLFK